LILREVAAILDSTKPCKSWGSSEHRQTAQ